jgi:hypothetical protein
LGSKVTNCKSSAYPSTTSAGLDAALIKLPFLPAVFPSLCHCDSAADPRAIRKDNIMSRRENDANNISRPSDSPLTEYEKEQVALRRNLKRLKAERLAREAANSKDD